MSQQAEPVQKSVQPPEPLLAVRYGYLGWVGEFRHDPALRFQWSDPIVIKTERGLEIGTLVAAAAPQTCCKCVCPHQQYAYVKASGEDHLQRGAGEVVRVATAEDLDEQARLDAQARDKLDFCQRTAMRVGLNTRMIACEHLLGGERIIFYFSAEGRIDFRQLVRELAREYHTRIEMRQIGARDEARIVADYEICGRECCCKNFLKVLRPVNMKMAKLQKATLDPTKVSGRCGRLRCCLRYEQQTYEYLDANLPEVGARVQTSQGVGIIRERQVLTQLLLLDMAEGRRLAVPLEEIKILPPGEIEQPAPVRRRGEPGPAREESERPALRRSAEKDEEGAPAIGEGARAPEVAAPARLPQRGGDNGRNNGRRAGGAGRPPQPPVRPGSRERPATDEERPGPAQGPDEPLGQGPAAQTGPGPAEQPGSARSGRRRRRRGRRPRGDGGSPRADDNSSSPP